ncbi:MAG: DsbA family protein [Neomegalonema sp.]|nr:DsbA family protein [Neomegalonema sp.]
MFASVRKLRGRVVAGAVLGALLAVGAAAPLWQSAEAENRYAKMSAEERKAFGKEVRAYLLENPGVIMEAVALLEARRKAEAIADVQKEVGEGLFITEDGAKDGKLLMVEFTDYDCPWCRRVRPEVASFLKSDKDVRYVVRVLPRVGSEAPERAAIAATLQDREKATKLHEAMMGHEGRLDPAAVLALAAKVGLDTDKLTKDMAGPAVATRLEKNNEAARRLGINGTPGFVLGSGVIPGAVPAAEFKRYAAQSRKDAAK